MQKDTYQQIYWANAMFSEADRNFNAKCASVLREKGYRVFLPQEAAVNKLPDESPPSGEDVFRVDTSAILDSDLLVACLDQETIDCGVACEVGIAFSYGIPILGLYTDIRQHRRGRGQMYKNLYVMGAIEAIGDVVSNIDALLQAVRKYLGDPGETRSPRKGGESSHEHFDLVATRYSEFVTRLESWYEPSWNIRRVVDRWFQAVPPERVVEFGCGTGDLGAYISQRYPSVFYLGYDKSAEMIRLAGAHHSNPSCVFVASLLEVERRSRGELFDVALVPFKMKVQINPRETMASLAQYLRSNGVILIIDLSTSDLPRLTNLLRRKVVRPLYGHDSRIDPARLSEFAQASDSSVIDCEIAMPVINFPSATDLKEYLEVFGIYEGMDLPLSLGDRKPAYRKLVDETLESQVYPFTDQRAFIICALKKR